MSFILDALKKSQQERDMAASPGAPASVVAGRHEPRRIMPWAIAGVVIFVIVLGGGVYRFVNTNKVQTPAEQHKIDKPQPSAGDIATKLKKDAVDVSSQVSPPIPKPQSEPRKQVAKQVPSDVRTADYYNKRGREFELEGMFDRAIEEYTQAILIDPGFVDAYIGRGWAHEANGEHELAIRSYNQAIKLKPLYAAAYLGRGWAYEQLGKPDLAIIEYGRAIKSMPDYADAYLNRGILNFYHNREEAAARDFSMVLENGDAGMRRYALLWLYLAKSRTGSNGKKEIEKKARGTNLVPWPGVIVSMYLGKARPKRVLRETRDGNPRKQLENECVAFFFIGQYHLIRGHRNKAAEYFNKTVATGVKYFRQYGAAREELRRMGRL